MHVPTPIVKSGFFFTPESHDERFPGTLTILDGGEIELEVTTPGTSSFTDFEEMMIGRLIGEIEGGYATLEGCSYRKKNFSLGGGASKSTIIADCAFVGRPMDKPEKFASMKFNVDGLSEWLCRSTVKIDVGTSFFDYTLTLEKPKPVECILPDGTHFKIDFDITVPVQENSPRLELNQRPYIQITPLQPQLLHFYQKLSHRITRFFSFVIGRPIAIEALKIKSADADATGKLQWSDLYFRSLNGVSRLPASFREILLTFPRIESNFEQVLSDWLKEWDNIEPALHHFFTVQDDTHRYADTRFISMAQALEAFHRRTSSDSTVWPKSEYIQKVEAILKGCPEGDREWLKQKLNFGNEITLAARIQQLITPFSNVFGSAESLEKMVRGIVRTRNYHAHYDPEGKKKALTGGPLVALTFRMRVLFVLCLLVRLGFSVKEASCLAKQDTLGRLLRTANSIDPDTDE